MKLKSSSNATYACFILFWVAVWDSVYAADETDERPNVLFLVVDDMNDWVNCLGGYEGKVITPHIDRLASRSMLFSNAHCPSPKCAPSRASVMTGLMPSTTGLYDNGHWWYPNLNRVDSIPFHFKKHGYKVVGAGKVFHHTAGNHPPNQWDNFQPIRFGEDRWFRGSRLNYPWAQHIEFPKGFPFSGVKGLGHENDWGTLPINDSEYDDEKTVRYAIEFLKDRIQNESSGTKTKPFFLACGLFRPHLPWYVPRKYFEQYPVDKIVLPKVFDQDRNDLPAEALKLAKARQNDFEVIRKAGRWRNAVQAYLASITCADDRLGKVLTVLDNSPLSQNTIVVLWSDHGWHLGQKGHWHKSTLWEEATRVPFIIHVPGASPGKCKRAVSLLHLYPTLLDLCKLPAPRQKLEGHSLKSLIRKSDAEWNHPARIEFGQGNVAIRSEQFRYIQYKHGGEEFYDHRSDPNEWKNLVGEEQFSGKIKTLKDFLPKDWAKSAPTKKAFQFDPEAFAWTHKESGRITVGK